MTITAWEGVEAVEPTDCEHARSGSYCNRVVSEAPGGWKAIWTGDGGSEPVSRAEAAAASVLAGLWDGVTASLTNPGPRITASYGERRLLLRM